MSENTKSVYLAGAEDGLIMGAIMALCAVCMGASSYHAAFFLPALLSAIAVPVYAYLMLARTYRRQPEVSTFSALWLQGICMFFFGSLIMAVVVYLAVKLLCPTFMPDQIGNFIAIYKEVDDQAAAQAVEMMQTLLDQGVFPTPIEISLELIYTAVFTGSLLSMVFSLIIRSRGRNKRFPTPPSYGD